MSRSLFVQNTQLPFCHRDTVLSLCDTLSQCHSVTVSHRDTAVLSLHNYITVHHLHVRVLGQPDGCDLQGILGFPIKGLYYTLYSNPVNSTHPVLGPIHIQATLPKDTSVLIYPTLRALALHRPTAENITGWCPQTDQPILLNVFITISSQINLL